MKHFNKVFFILLAVFSLSSLNAQDADNPWSIEIGTNTVDFYPTGAGEDAPDVTLPVEPPPPLSSGEYLGDMFEDFFNTDHWNTAAIVSRLRVGRYIGAGFSVGLAGSFNSISKIGEYETNKNMSYFGTDLDIKWSPFNQSWFDPYLMLGGGYTWIEDNGNGTVNGGLGMNFWFNDFIGANVQSMYKHSFDNEQMLPHFQHALGLTIKFGGKDTDGDGIYDKDDACPEVAGLEIYNGCPDTDGDGIIDSQDACPTEAGLAELNGCPDRDGDGIADKDDACPDTFGLAQFNGCPDTDGDGIIDSEDKCPTEAGPLENQGCPLLDADGDGIVDKDDLCPTVPGTVANHGCPEVTQLHKDQLKEIARTVYFDNDKTTWNKVTDDSLDAIKAILINYPMAKWHIEGHTDSVGRAEYNMGLSDRRANAVRDALIERGLNPANLTAKGYGEEQPIEDNKTRKGRAVNRRVELKLANPGYEDRI